MQQAKPLKSHGSAGRREIPDICNRPPHASATLWRTWSHMATHASTRTTQLYDRRRDDVTFDEVAKINIKG